MVNLGAGGLAGLCVMALATACTVKPARPVVGAALVDVAAIDDERGLLVFRPTSAEGEASRLYLASHDTQGAVDWTRTIALPGPTSQRPPMIFGGSALLMLEGEDDSARSLLRVDLARGEASTLTGEQPGDPRRLWRIVGDADQVFVFWTATAARSGEALATHEVTAFSAVTGEQQWTFTGQSEPHTLMRRWPVRLDARWLMYSDGQRDWQLLRRSDGWRDETVVDPPGLCQAGGRWWGQRGDRLLALTTTDESVFARDVEADFIAPEWRHQWSLADCGESGEDVVLIAEAGAGAMVVGVNRAEMFTRWKVPVPANDRPRTPTDVPAGPRRFGEVALVSGYAEHCAVDLRKRALLWCVDVRGQHDEVIADGEDSLLWTAGYDEQLLVRISGADGEVDAAVELTGVRQGDASVGDVPAVVGGKIWLASASDPGAAVGGRLPHVVLDARTLRPIERPAFTSTGAADPDPPQIFIRDVIGELDTLYVGRPTDRSIPPARVAVDPLEHWAFAGPRPAGARDPAFPGLREAVLGDIRASAGLEPDARVRVIAWRVTTGVVHGIDDAGRSTSEPARRYDLFAVHQEPDRLPFVLFRVDGFTEDPIGPRNIHVRSFDRRPSESDLHRFILEARPSWDMINFDDTHGTTRGVIDEAVWRSVTGEPRAQRWML